MEVNNPSVDIAMVRLAKSGDQKAFERLMEKYERPIYFMILKMVRNRSDAEDLTMQAFTKAFRNIHSYSEDFSFSTWLFKIGTNSCIDFIRQKKLMVSSLNTSATDTTETDEQTLVLPDPNHSPETVFIQEQRASRIREIVNKLPEKYRIFIELRYYEELSYDEIAACTDIPVGTVKAKLHRAKELLYELYNPRKNQF